VHPNQLIELRPDGALVLQVIPEAPGRCRVRRLDFVAPEPTRGERALNYLARRLLRGWLRQDGDLACSIQSALAGSDYQARHPADPARS